VWYPTPNGPTTAELGALLSPLGGRLVQAYRLGDGTTSHRIELPTHEAKVRLLDKLGAYDARLPEVRRIAELAAAGSASPVEQIAKLHAFVRGRVLFTGEPSETFSPTLRVLELGAGDCDDHTRVMLALLRSMGHKAAPMTLGSPPRHVAAGVVLDGRQWWLETTIDAHPGEHPLAAAKRLGIQTRPDLG